MSVPQDLREKILKEIKYTKSSLVRLVIAVFLAERYATGGYDDWMTAPLSVQKLTIDVIREVVAEHAPEETPPTDTTDELMDWTLRFEQRIL